MVAPMSVARDAVGVCVLGDRLFAVGGYDGQQYLTLVEAYDPILNEWQQVGDFIDTQPRLFLRSPGANQIVLLLGSAVENWPGWSLCRCEQFIPESLEG